MVDQAAAARTSGIRAQEAASFTRGAAMAGEQGQLLVQLQAGPDLDAEELGQLADRLQSELLELDVDAVRPVEEGEAPEGSKGVGLLALGGLLVQFAGPDVLQSVISGIRSWLGRQRARSVKLTLDGDSIELTAASSADQARLIDLWVARHAGDH
jgi:hypothetical protein